MPSINSVPRPCDRAPSEGAVLFPGGSLSTVALKETLHKLRFLAGARRPQFFVLERSGLEWMSVCLCLSLRELETEAQDAALGGAREVLFYCSGPGFP